jgi:ubiquinone biosynthesis monooxygenase Coq7
MRRHYSSFDRILIEIDKAVRTIYARPGGSGRPNPSYSVAEPPELSDSDRKRGARLMRINHAGEVAAQGLYQGQALTARSRSVRSQLHRSAEEENDHLVWCDQRLDELGGHRSYLGPLWYTGAFVMGAVTGWVGDRWSLGFVNETERQVVKHLDEHLQRLPVQDTQSQCILEQMKLDETHHAYVAISAGAAELPTPIKRLMGLVSKVMTRTAYWI